MHTVIQWDSGPTNAYASTSFHVAIIGFQLSSEQMVTLTHSKDAYATFATVSGAGYRLQPL
jgi:hypothetical protein